MSKFPSYSPAQPLRTSGAVHWHAAYLTMLPAIQRQAQRSFRRLRWHDREEASW